MTQPKMKLKLEAVLFFVGGLLFIAGALQQGGGVLPGPTGPDCSDLIDADEWDDVDSKICAASEDLDAEVRARLVDVFAATIEKIHNPTSGVVDVAEVHEWMDEQFGDYKNREDLATFFGEMESLRRKALSRGDLPTKHDYADFYSEVIEGIEHE